MKFTIFFVLQEGKLATGILTPLAKNAGFASVSQFLTESSDEVAQWAPGQVAAVEVTWPSHAHHNKVSTRAGGYENMYSNNQYILSDFITRIRYEYLNEVGMSTDKRTLTLNNKGQPLFKGH